MNFFDVEMRIKSVRIIDYSNAFGNNELKITLIAEPHVRQSTYSKQLFINNSLKLKETFKYQPMDLSSNPLALGLISRII